MMRTVAILGSTGSIGKNTLKVIAQLKGKFKVVGLTCGANIACFARQINEIRPQIAAVESAQQLNELKKALRAKTKLVGGPLGVEQVAAFGADIVVMAIGGSAALIPTIKALAKTRRLALANKECLVMAGELVMRLARENAVEIIPIDSEHSAIFQCLKQEPLRSLEKIYLTGSGGPLKDIPSRDLKFIKPSFALRHPRWKMGKKISIDSATLMNKGLELIEAHYLFGLSPEKIEILIHPEAVVHSLVQFIDGSILAQMGAQDMRIPIQYSLTYPDRTYSGFSRLNFSQLEKLTFRFPDLKKFPCLGLAIAALRKKGLALAVLNAADEECVWSYLRGEINIIDIPRIIEKVLSKLKNRTNPSLKEILQIDSWAREATQAYLKRKAIG